MCERVFLLDSCQSGNQTRAWGASSRRSKSRSPKASKKKSEPKNPQTSSIQYSLYNGILIFKTHFEWTFSECWAVEVKNLESWKVSHYLCSLPQFLSRTSIASFRKELKALYTLHKAWGASMNTKCKYSVLIIFVCWNISKFMFYGLPRLSTMLGRLPV